MKFLLISFQASSKETSPKTQQQVGEDGPKDGSFDDGYLVIAAADQDHKQDDFHERTQCRLKNGAYNVRELAAELLSREAEQVS